MTDDKADPDLAWCLERSTKVGLSPRCPFASVERCPRYYQSLSLLGEAGSTAINAKEDERLKAYWKKSDLWPRTAEYETSVSGSETVRHFSNFCPEVAYDRFGYFASYLADYSDEIDRDVAHESLGRKVGTSARWRWQWASLTATHFSECPLYSPLKHGGGFPSRTGPRFTISVPGISAQFEFSWRDLNARLTRFRLQIASIFRPSRRQ